MGAANFHTVNVGNIYVVYDRWYNEEDGHEALIEWSEIKENIQCA